MDKQAILIIAHNNIDILIKTMKLLDSKYFDIYIHLDTKSNINPDTLKDVCKISTVNIAKEINVRWGDYSLVQCELLLLKLATKNKYSFYHLISGVDMPLKSNDIIYKFFRNNKRKEFVHFEGETLPPNKQDWLKYYYLFRKYGRNSLFTKGLEYVSLKIQKLLHVNRVKNVNITFMTGAQWFSITHNFATYILKSEKKYEKIFKYARNSDEMFVQTIIFNSPFINNLYYKKCDDNYESVMRFVDWKRGNPYIFRSSDYDELINSDMMFARKFDERVDSKIIDEIYDKLIKRS